jgi:hypothetical protein
MTFQVINNPDFAKFQKRSGFKNSEFKMLAGLFSRAASVKALYDMSVDVDFEEGTCSISYFLSGSKKPHLSFIVRQVGPHTDMYEVHKQGAGKIMKSGLFARAFEKLSEEVELLMPK